MKSNITESQLDNLIIKFFDEDNYPDMVGKILFFMKRNWSYMTTITFILMMIWLLTNIILMVFI